MPPFAVSAFGFITDRGVKEAVDEVIKLRSKYQWTFETDIQKFFDNIDRNKLTSLSEPIFGRSSLMPLLKGVIHCEVKETHEIKLSKFGLKKGRGVRQGMPLSPLLSNIALRRFDASLTSLGIPAVRYVDDLVAFASSRHEAEKIGLKIKELLQNEGLEIPNISENGKTKVSSSGDPVNFLGWSIKYKSSEGAYRRYVSDDKIAGIRLKIASIADVEQQIRNHRDLTQTLRQLSQTANSYRTSYSRAENAQSVIQAVSESVRDSKTKILTDLFGNAAVQNLTPRQKEFIGLDATYDEIEFMAL